MQWEGKLSQDNAEELAAQAERCRRLAGATYNREVSEILGKMADQFQRAANDLDDKSEPTPSSPRVPL